MSYKLGRVIDHDPRNRDHAFTATPSPTRSRDILWPRHSPILDQGDLGSCTGNAMTGWLGCAPHVITADDADKYDQKMAVEIYSLATQYDSFPGQYPPEDTGSSGNAAAKAARSLGLISSWSWAFTTATLMGALQAGPVLIGAPWYEGMFTPDSDGRVWATGEMVGGHEFLARGIEGMDIICDNSWGADWGQQGSFRIPLSVWMVLRAERADVTIPHI